MRVCQDVDGRKCLSNHGLECERYALASPPSTLSKASSIEYKNALILSDIFGPWQSVNIRQSPELPKRRLYSPCSYNVGSAEEENGLLRMLVFHPDFHGINRKNTIIYVFLGGLSTMMNNATPNNSNSTRSIALHRRINSIFPDVIDL